MVSPTPVGERIRTRRLELGLSQRELSAPGVSYAYISRIEAGFRRPSVKALRKLAPKLGVSVYWLETGREDPAEQLARMVRDGHGNPISDEALALADEILTAGSAPN
jgi:transcriptional regulator with XRE-family HTH domain